MEWGILNDIEINLPFVVTSLAFTGLPDVFRICCMYTFTETYLQLRVGMISAVFWLHVNTP